MKDEKILFEQFLQGDRQAFEQLVLSLRQGLVRFVYGYIHDEYESEDIAQEAFAYLAVYPERYRRETSVKSYLYSIAKNKAVDYIRKNRKTIPLEDWNGELIDSSDLADDLIRQEDAEAVRKCMARLKPDHQAAIRLVEWEEMSYREAAASMGRSVPQFKVLLHRARQALKKELLKG